MDFEAIVHLVLPEVKGEGARGQWTKQEVVFQLANDQYDRKICVGFWNDKAPSAAALRVGERLVLSVNIESRQRNGRRIKEARAWKFTILSPTANVGGGAHYTSEPPMGAPAPINATPATPVADDLPF